MKWKKRVTEALQDRMSPWSVGRVWLSSVREEGCECDGGAENGEFVGIFFFFSIRV